MNTRRISAGVILVAGGVLLTGCTGSPAQGESNPSADGYSALPTRSPLVFETHTPATTPASTIGAGSYVVGQDVELGRYSAGDDVVAQCRWLQTDDEGNLLDADDANRPTQVLTLSSEGTKLVVAGDDCVFTRLPDGEAGNS